MGNVSYTPINIARTTLLATIPKYEAKTSAGMDVTAAGGCLLFPQQKIIVPTGLIVFPEGGETLEIRPSSKLSLNTPLEMQGSPAIVEYDYADPIAVVIKNTSLPTVETWQDESYIKLFNYLQEHGMENGNLSKEDFVRLREIFGEIQTIKGSKNNIPGIYSIMPGDMIAQIMLRDGSRIEWKTEEFVSEYYKERVLKKAVTKEEKDRAIRNIEISQESNRFSQLEKVKRMALSTCGFRRQFGRGN